MSRSTETSLTPAVLAAAFAHPETLQAKCRRCGDCDVLRIRRWPFDRLISLVYPVKRYRCLGAGCDWQGRLPARFTSRGGYGRRRSTTVD